ncbi:MAG: arylsulfatase [Planctomycetota bacterium]
MFCLCARWCLLAILIPLGVSVVTANDRRPNIIYILADDLGYGDLGCYGQTKIQTPHIDRLADEGIRFTQHYSGAPVCAPARCVLLTGLHAGHAPIRNNRALKHEGNVPIPSSYKTLGEVMKEAGYATGAFGKWGQGFPGSECDPVKRGFDVFYGYNCQREAHQYYPDHLWHNEEKVMLNGNANGQQQQYSHDLIAQAALDFISKDREEPFFAYVPFTIPHTKFQVPDLGKYEGKAWNENQIIQAAMISRMDRDIGRIVEAVKSIGAEDNTLIIFTSDNGPHGGGGTLDQFNAAGPLRAKKGSTYEGGIRVPFIARWPGRIEAGSVSDHLSGFHDMLPTFAELARASAPDQIDGISMLPTLFATGTQPQHNYLYWELGNKQGLRVADWKLVRDSSRKTLAPLELYDLSSDVGESQDLAEDNPEVLKRLANLLQEARHPSELFPNPLLDGVATASRP